MTRVSVVIPTYNRSALLEVALQSVLAQDYADLEIIVVDDGCTDDTAQVVAKYGSRVKYVKQENSGLPGARNTGIRTATGEYLCFLDDDDFYLPGKVRKQACYLDAHPELDIVACQHVLTDESGQFTEWSGTIPEGEVFHRFLLEGCFVTSGGPLVRRSVYERVGLFDEQSKGSEDWDMWLRISGAGYRFGCVQEPLYAYRQYSVKRGNMSSRGTGVESGQVTLLTKIFAHREIGPQIAHLRNQAFAMMRARLSSIYYVAGDWDNASRNLGEAVRLYPSAFASTPQWLNMLRYWVLRWRIADPVRFAHDIMDHLPPNASHASHARPHLIRQARFAESFRSFARGHVADGRRQLTEAITATPDLLNYPEDFVESLSYHAMVLVVDPLPFATLVIDNLPDVAGRLSACRARILSKVQMACAFQAHTLSNWPEVIRNIASSLLNYPSNVINNRGAVAILIDALRKNYLGRIRPAANPR